MPVRTKVKSRVIASKTVRLTRDYKSERRWHPSCNRSPNLTASNSCVSHDSEETTTQVTRMDWISSTDSEFLRDREGKIIEPPQLLYRSNPCEHIVQERKTSGIVDMLLHKHKYVTAEAPIGECGNHEWTQTLLQDYQTLQITDADAFGELAINEGSKPNVPYFDPGDQAHRLKLDVLDRIAIDTMGPKIDAAFNLPLQLGELRESLSLWKHVHKLGVLSGIFQKVPTRGRNARRAWKREFSKPLNSISNHFLATVFGWLPLIGSFKTFVQSYIDADRVITKFIEESGKRKTLHFQKALSPLTFQSEPWFEGIPQFVTIDTLDHNWQFASDLFSEVSVEVNLKKVVTDLSFHGTMDFAYHLPGIPPGALRMAAELEYWGAYLNPQDLWNLIPFSFVLDWFVKIGPWLEQFSLHALPVTVYVFSYSRSIKFLLKESIVPIRPTFIDLGGGNGNEVLLWSVSTTSPFVERQTEYYWRAPYKPVRPSTWPSWRSPKGLFWVFAGTALLVPRLTKY